MARAYTTDELLAKVRLLGAFPLDRSTFVPADAVQIMDMVMRVELVPFIMNANARHFLVYKDYTASASQTSYAIPEDAVNRNLVSVVYVSDSGEESPLTVIDHQEDIRERFSALRYPWGAAYIEGDYLKVIEPVEGRTLRLYYHRFPAQLVLVASAAKISSFSTSVGAFTNLDIVTEGLPAAWSSGSRTISLVKGSPAFDTRASSFVAATSSPNVTVEIDNPASVDSDDVAGLNAIAAGDYLTDPGTSPIPQVPAEAHEVLAQMTVVKILEALGDKRMDKAETRLASMLASYQTILQPRVQKAPPMIVNRNKLSDWLI